MRNEILTLVEAFNEKVKDAITGPNCIDPSICLGDCCFVTIDIPRVLAEYYIKEGLATPSDFIRGTMFSFRIQVDLDRCKCVFFDPDLNGCSLHSSLMKTPQCWVYPTGLDPEDFETQCKRSRNWNISDPILAKDANEILKKYVELCKSEAIIENSEKNIIARLQKGFANIFLNFAPHQIAGVQDGWEEFQMLKGEGYSMSIKHFCSSIQCDQVFFSCSQVCTKAWQKIQDFLLQILPLYIQTEGFREEYSFVELLPFAEEAKGS